MHSIVAYKTQDGGINYGQMIRDWRKIVLGWKNVEIAVRLLNESLDDEDKVSIRWWQRMEQNNAVPVDEKRRWIIQAILNIPPSYLGLAALSAIIPSPEATPTLMKKEAVDLRVYRTRMPDLWRSEATRNPATRTEIAARIASLEEAFVYGGEQQRSEVGHLLCHYLLTAGNILRYQGYFAHAISYLNKALALAQDLDDYELRTKGYYLYGFTHFNHWTNRRQEDSTDLMKAAQAFQQAHHLAREAATNKVQLPTALTGAILADGGRASAYAARDAQTRLAAINTIDHASQQVAASTFHHSPGYLRVDKEWLLINKGEALLASGAPGSAIEVLEQVYGGEPEARQRYLYTAVIEAEAYIARGWGDVGIGYLERALNALNETTARRHLSHIMLIHERLKSDEKYKKSPDVARISVQLLKIQHPELFK